MPCPVKASQAASTRSKNQREMQRRRPARQRRPPAWGGPHLQRRGRGLCCRPGQGQPQKMKKRRLAVGQLVQRLAVQAAVVAKQRLYGRRQALRRSIARLVGGKGWLPCGGNGWWCTCAQLRHVQHLVHARQQRRGNQRQQQPHSQPTPQLQCSGVGSRGRYSAKTHHTQPDTRHSANTGATGMERSCRARSDIAHWPCSTPAHPMRLLAILCITRRLFRP